MLGRAELDYSGKKAGIIPNLNLLDSAGLIHGNFFDQVRSSVREIYSYMFRIRRRSQDRSHTRIQLKDNPSGIFAFPDPDIFQDCGASCANPK